MKRARRTFWRRLGRYLAGLLAVLTLAAVGGCLWLRTSLPQTSGTLRLAGIAAPVEILRDGHGIPHIRAETDGDAYFALGFVHAQDRLFQMEFMRRLGAGRLSELVGRSTLSLDRRMRILGLYRLAEAAFAQLGPEPRSAFLAYARGVNAYIETHPGVLAPELVAISGSPEPWRPADSLVWARIMAMLLSGNFWNEALRARLADRLTPGQIEDLWPDTTGEVAPTLTGAELDKAQPLFAGLMAAWPDVLAPITASNSWAVAGSDTRTGRPILANDPHLRFRAPVMWYLARIETPTLSLAGATVAGVPLTILGHNGTIAWGFTTTDSDTQDLFVEKLDPGDGGRYLTPDGFRPLTIRTETIRIRGEEPVTVTVRASRHGPLISDLDPETQRLVGPNRAVALAATALRADDRTAEAIWRLNRAGSWDAFIAAMEHFHSPQQNITYADTEGNIGFIAPGRVPIRRAGDGNAPVPGWSGSHDWVGLIPFEALPRSFNPASGRIVNANHRVVGPDYPYRLGVGDTPPYRAQRIHAMLDQDRSATVELAGRMLLDPLSLAARDLVPLMTAIEPGGVRSAHARDLLRRWDGRMAADRPEPLIFTAWLRSFNRALYADEMGALFPQAWRLRPVFVRNVLRSRKTWCDDIATTRRESCSEMLARALDMALAELSVVHGEDIAAWRWGDAHYAHFSHPMLGTIPLLDRIGDIRIAANGGAFTVNRAQNRVSDRQAPYASVHGPGLRAVYDLSDLDRSLFVIATGQSGNPLSRNYRDLTPLWAEGRYVRIPYLSGRLARDASGLLRLVPAPDEHEAR